ncbi:hypothetical protein Tco_0276135 [Tanacetum coccineum]
MKGKNRRGRGEGNKQSNRQRRGGKEEEMNSARGTEGGENGKKQMKERGGKRRRKRRKNRTEERRKREGGKNEEEGKEGGGGRRRRNYERGEGKRQREEGTNRRREAGSRVKKERKDRLRYMRRRKRRNRKEDEGKGNKKGKNRRRRFGRRERKEGKRGEHRRRRRQEQQWGGKKGKERAGKEGRGGKSQEEKGKKGNGREHRIEKKSKRQGRRENQEGSDRKGKREGNRERRKKRKKGKTEQNRKNQKNRMGQKEEARKETGGERSTEGRRIEEDQDPETTEKRKNRGKNRVKTEERRKKMKTEIRRPENIGLLCLAPLPRVSVRADSSWILFCFDGIVKKLWEMSVTDGSDVYIMADVNAPVPIGKSNCYLDAEKSQSNPIYKIAVDILKHTNFFRAFTASSTIPTIYIQQFWDTICYDRTDGGYKCQLDEQWFNLTKDHTSVVCSSDRRLVNNKQAFSSPPPGNLGYFTQPLVVNGLGYPKEVKHLSNVVTNDMFQPWRALTTIINLCLTGKTSGFERPRAPVLQILWGVINRAHIDYVERIKHRQTRAKAGKVAKKRTLKRSQQLVDEFVDEGIPLTEPGFGDLEADTQRAIEESLKDAHGAHRGPLPPVVFRETDTGKFQPLPEVEGKGKEKVGAEQAARVLLNLQTPKKKSPTEQYIFQRRTSAPTEPSGHDESSSLYAELGLTESDTESDEEVPPVVKSGAPDEGQAGPNPGIQDEGQAGPNPGNDTVSQTLSTPGVHAGPNLEHTDAEATDATSQPQPGQMDEEFTATAYPNIQENLKLTVDDPVIPEEPASSTGTLSSLQHLAKDFSFGDQFFNDKPSEANNEKTTADTEAESMVSVTIHQDTSAIPPMTSPVMDLVYVPDSPTVHRPLPTTTTATATTTTTTIMTTVPLPPQPQQVSSDSILLNRLGELEQHIADLVDANQALEERLDKHGSRLYKLENQDIPNQVSKAVDEIVTDAVDWAMNAPLRERFRDLPEADMKEILHNRMWESKSYQTHEDHMTLYEALEKSMARDNRDQLLSDLAEARKKKKKRQGSPKTPSGSPPHPPPPPPPPAGPSGTSGASGASGSSQSPPPPPPPSNTQGGQSTGTDAPSSSKTAASAEYTAWTMTDTTIKPSIEELHMDDDTTHDEQVQSSGDEDIGHDHIPTVNLRQNWWKPLTEDRPATPEPIWSIPSSNLPIPFCKKQGITELKQQDLEGPAYEIVKVFHPNVIHLQYQMEECHKLLTDQVDESIIRPALSISKMKAAYYPDVGLEQMVPDQMWIEEECKYDIAAMYGISHWWFQRQRFYIDRHTSEGDRRAVRTHMRIISVVRIEVFSLYGYDYIKMIVLRRAGLKEYPIAERDFKYMYPSEFEDLYLLNLQGHLNHLPPEDKKILTTVVNLWTRNLIDEALDYKVKEFKVNRMNPGLNTRFWTRKDVDRSKEFMFAIQKRLKTRRIFRNLESFVGGRIREGDYRLLKRTE